MADATRSKKSMERWEDAFAKLSASMTSKFDELLARMNQLETSHATAHAPPSFANSAATATANTAYRLKLEVPRFDGTDPEGWIFKVTQFFEYHATPEHDRLTIASFYMEGPALAWFQWMYHSGQLSSWSAFLHAIHARFSSSAYEDPTGVFCKLTQRTTVSAYLSEFETLANRVIGLPAPFLLSCFISGLNPAIRRDVQVMQPHSLAQAVSFVRLHEEKLLDSRRQASKSPSSPTPGTSITRTSSSLISPPTDSSLLPPPSRPRNSSIPFKRLTPSELALRREQGLCFNCDEKYSRGHKCASSLFLFVTEDDDDNRESDPGPSQLPSALQESVPAQISLHALSGHGAPETLRLTGFICEHRVQILIDGGSTHNFLQQKLVALLQLQPHETSTLRVTVGNGEELQCNQVCPNLAVKIQKHEFQVDLHVLPIWGADVVLGVQWLKALGPVLTDYTAMKFIYNDQLIELVGDRDSSLQMISPSQLRRLVDTGNTSTFFHIKMEPSLETPINITHPLPAVQQLLSKYASLFQPLSTLPPSRATDHSITLLPNSTRVNVKPYRYPHFQKQEIETQVAAMLRQGHIQHSSSPFSSPVLLV